MKRNELARAAILLLLASTVGIAQTTPPPEPPPITFAASVVAAGDSWTEYSSYSTTAELKLNNGYEELTNPVEVTKSVEQRKTVKVTNVVGNDRITGVEVGYALVKLNGSDLTSSFAGKTYRVTVSGNKPASVTYADGSAVPATEAAFVSSDNNRLGQMRAMNKTFGGKSVKQNELPLVMRASDPTELIDAEAGMRVRDFEMKLTKIEGEGAAQTATFELVLLLSSGARKPKEAATSDPDPFDTSAMDLDLRGILVANVATSRIMTFELAGPSTISARKNDPKGKKGSGSAVSERFQSVSGTGTAEMEAIYTYP